VLYTLLQISFLAPAATEHPLLPCFSHFLTLQHSKSVLAIENQLRSHKLALQLRYPRQETVSAIIVLAFTKRTSSPKRGKTTLVPTATATHWGSSLTYTTRRPFTHNEAPHCNIARLRNTLLRIIIHTPSSQRSWSLAHSYSTVL
jgi:hypothetical protein